MSIEELEAESTFLLEKTVELEQKVDNLTENCLKLMELLKRFLMEQGAIKSRATSGREAP